jgi:hypothetical protein
MELLLTFGPEHYKSLGVGGGEAMGRDIPPDERIETEETWEMKRGGKGTE